MKTNMRWLCEDFTMWFGWTEVYIDDSGMPSPEETPWKASVFVLFTHVIYVGKVKPA